MRHHGRDGARDSLCKEDDDRGNVGDDADDEQHVVLPAFRSA